MENNELNTLVRQLYDIFTYDLSSNCHRDDHIEYALYRLNGGELSEEDWYFEQCGIRF